MIFSSSHEIAGKLKYFSFNPSGKPVLKLDLKVCDFHTHLGFSYLFTQNINLLKGSMNVRYELPADIPIDLDKYSGESVARYGSRKRIFAKTAGKLLTARTSSQTQTIPNLLEEMDRFNIKKSIVLPVDLPFSAKVTRNYLRYNGFSDRIIFFCFASPLSLRWKANLRSFVAAGARGLKIHPYTLLASPDSARIMAIIDEWQQYRLPILIHTGFSGIEPGFSRKWLSVEKYEAPIRKYNKQLFVLGHSGASQYKKAIDLSRRYKNVVLELSGQPPKAVRDVVRHTDPDRIVFGSDWPFYPIIVPLAKVLLGTEDDKSMRDKIFCKNFERVVGKAYTLIKTR